jgi:cephalosporin-C deacetylase-like acetyl esterase
LIQRPEVDSEQIGCTGNSGGGTMTSYLMAFDARIKAAAPSCYLTTLERLFDTIGPQDAEQNFAGQAALGIDHADYIHLHAPQPTLMCVATRDFFDNDGAWTTFREAKQFYSMLGHSERMNIIDYDDEHGFSKPRRVAAMRFMRRWLLGKDDNPDEGEMTLSSDAELQCTKSGDVLLEFPEGVSATDLTRLRAESLGPQRDGLWRGSKEEGLSAARRLSGFRPSRDVPSGTVSDSIPADDQEGFGWRGEIEKLVLRRKGEVVMPALLFRPMEVSGRRPAVVYASGSGKVDATDPAGRCVQLAREGHTVLAIDVRGIGEAQASIERRRDGYFGSDFETCLLALHLNRPLLGQRAEDMQAAINYLLARDDVDPEHLQLVGTGKCGPAAIHLAAFDDRVTTLTVVSSIESWMDVVNEPLGVDQLTNVVPSALEYYDLPNLVESIRPRSVVIEAPVDPRGQPKR